MHRDEPHASGFRDALERLREYTIAGHLQVRRKERSGNNFTERAVASLRARKLTIHLRGESIFREKAAASGGEFQMQAGDWSLRKRT